jgi:uncharacterized protein (DUF58 family)
MPYLLAIVIVGIAVVLGLFTIWGGIIFLFVAALVAAAVFAFRARDVRVERTSMQPTGTPRASPGGAETANERVGT